MAGLGRARRANRPPMQALALRRGAAVVEFAVVAPVVLLLIFGIIEFGRLMMVQEAMNTAARVACREASLATTLNAADVDTAARNFMHASMPSATDSTKVRVTLTPASLAGIASGTPVNVVIDANFSDITWLPSHLVNVTGGNRVMRAEAQFDRE